MSLLAAVLGTILLAGTARPAEAATSSLPVRVLIDSLSPATVSPGDTITITGRVTNSGTEPLTNLDVRLRTQYLPIGTRSGIQDWVSGTSTVTDPVRGSSHRITAALAPQATASFRLTVPARALNLPDSASAFGARGAALDVIGHAGGGSELLGQQRTFVIWVPDVQVSPTRLTLLTPVTSTTASADATVPSADLLASLAPQGRLGRVVAATGDTGFSWALDPAVLAAAWQSEPGHAKGLLGGSATATGSGNGQDGASASPSSTPASGSDGSGPAPGAADATGWLDAIRSGLSGRDAVALPLADPDLASIAHTGTTTTTSNYARSLYGAGRTLAGTVTKQVLGSTLRADVAWPVNGLADQATVNLAASRVGRAVVLSGASQPTTQDLNYTPSGRSVLAVTGAVSGRLPGLIYDDALSVELAATGGATPVLATQQLLADLITLTAERPNQSRAVLAVTPRNWDPSPAGVQAAAQALRGASSWLQLDPLSALQARAAPNLRRVLTYPAAARAAELPAQQMRAAAKAENDVERLAPALTRPADVVPALEARAVSLAGQAWRAQRAGQPVGVASLVHEVNALYAAISVVSGSSQNLLSHSGSLPVVLQNDLNQPVEVIVTLRPQMPRLRVTASVPATVPAHGRQQVFVPVKAIGNGDVLVDVQLSTRAQTLLGTAAPIEVRVHPEWENRGLGIVGALLAILVVVGLVRGVRRGRTRVPPETVPDADEEVVQREAVLGRWAATPPYGMRLPPAPQTPSQGWWPPQQHPGPRTGAGPGNGSADRPTDGPVEWPVDEPHAYPGAEPGKYPVQGPGGYPGTQPGARPGDDRGGAPTGRRRRGAR